MDEWGWTENPIKSSLIQFCEYNQNFYHYILILGIFRITCTVYANKVCIYAQCMLIMRMIKTLNGLDIPFLALHLTKWGKVALFSDYSVIWVWSVLVVACISSARYIFPPKCRRQEITVTNNLCDKKRIDVGNEIRVGETSD